MIRRSTSAAIAVATVITAAGPLLGGPLPVRGIHLPAPKPDDLPLAVRFIQEALPKEGVNLLVLEFNYRFQFTRRPEVSGADALSLDAREATRRGMPGRERAPDSHDQSAGAPVVGENHVRAVARRIRSSTKRPASIPDNQGIYCRSYCPLHPEVHDVVFDLIDELMEATGADAFHVGMDEVFLLGEDDCPRCRGKNKAELFAQEVKTHARASGRDAAKRCGCGATGFLDGDDTGIGKWEASANQTEPAVRLIPKDIVICDWHYEQAHPTAGHFALDGFRVVSSPWRRTSVALEQLAQIRDTRVHSSPEIGGRMLGVLQTTWVGFAPFVQAYFNEAPAPNTQALEAVQCFRELFRELRTMN